MEDTTLLRVQIADAYDSDPSELRELTGSLRRELLELDVDEVELATDPALPDTAKAGGVSLPDLLIVSLSNSAALAAVIRLLQGWITRSRGRKVTIKLGKDSVEIDGASREEEAKLIASWIDQHQNH
jgi:hypothetical protein